jgi:hypothetical protein
MEQHTLVLKKTSHVTHTTAVFQAGSDSANTALSTSSGGSSCQQQ